MKKNKKMASLAMLILLVGIFLKWSQPSVEEPNDEVSEVETKADPSINRSPSSILGSIFQKSKPMKAGIKVSSYNKKNFNTNAEAHDPLEDNSRTIASQSDSSLPFAGSPQPSSAPDIIAESADVPILNKKDEQLPLQNDIHYIDHPQLNNNTAPDGPSVLLSPPQKTTNVAYPKTPYSCSSNSLGGTFNSPIAITLSCNESSTIKYCVSYNATTADNCCDPETEGYDYNSALKIGTKNGYYCVSYLGTSSSTNESVSFQQTYIINSTLPNLQVGHPKVYYQTTELNGVSYVTSNDFGKPGYDIGQVNLKTHDPTTSGLNLSCDEIINNYVSLPAPTPTNVLDLLDVSVQSPTNQIEIPLRPDTLDYGDNFVTSFIVNNNNLLPLYSCSTTKVTLNDFAYFDSSNITSMTGTNSFQEFSGGFNTYGFFESESNVYRSPSGELSNNSTDIELHSEFFGIFF